MSSPGEAQPKRKIDWLTLAQFGLGATAISVTWLVALGGALGALQDVFALSPVNDSPLSNLIVIAGVFIISLLLIPSTYHALRRILNLESRPFKFFGSRFGLVILLLPLLAWLGIQTENAELDGLSLVLHLLGAVLSIAWLLWLALRHLRLDSAQRSWGALTAGLSATTPIVFVLEGLGMLALILLFSLYVQLNPQLSQMIERIPMVNTSPNEVVGLGPFINDPVVLMLVLAGISVLAPVVEELLKPLGVYFLLGRGLSDAQGFMAGALCGAGYALIENLLLNTEGATLAFVALGRFGASAMHVFTAALIGLALARAKRSGKWLLVLGTLLINMLVHGSWNALVVLTAAGQVTAANGSGLIPQQMQTVGPILLVVLALSCVVALARLNRNMVEYQAELFVNSL